MTKPPAEVAQTIQRALEQKPQFANFIVAALAEQRQVMPAEIILELEQIAGQTTATITHGVSGIYGWHNGLPVGIFSSVEGAKRYLEELASEQEE